MLSREQLEEVGVEWVQPSRDGRRGYFRRIPGTRKSPTVRQAQHRLAFSKISFSLYGTKGGEIQDDGRVISKNAVEIGRVLQGTGEPVREPTLTEKLIQLILTNRVAEVSTLSYRLSSRFKNF